MQQVEVKYNFEYDRKLRICFIGAGRHSFRNVYPTFQYAPVDLLAVCDMDGDRAADYARLFGAQRHYTNHIEMLERERPDAVFIVTSYHPDGRVQATDLAMDALKRGVHVWMEKPTAATTGEIQQLMDARRESGKFVMSGLKKVFFPAIEKVKQIITSPEFGTPSSMYIRYPQKLPPFADRADLSKIKNLVDHIYHPGAILHYLMGNIHQMSYLRDPFNEGSVTSMRFVSGAVGTMHMTGGRPHSSPLERLEIIGKEANVVVDNGVKLTYYRKTVKHSYGRTASYFVPDESAPLHWEPEFSLGQLYNKNIFMLGYVPEVLHFCESVLSGEPPQKGTLEASMEICKMLEVYRFSNEGELTTLNDVQS